MTTKNAPATKLLWKLHYKGAGGWTFTSERAILECRSIGMDKAMADDALRALNAYSRLVEALRTCSRVYGRSVVDAADARALLRNLGEAAEE